MLENNDPMRFIKGVKKFEDRLKKQQAKTNERVIDLLKERLDEGQRTYGQDIPLNGEGGRDNLKESLDEALDLAIYLCATILELKDRRNEDK